MQCSNSLLTRVRWVGAQGVERASLELQIGDDESLDYKRSTALDQVISGSVDVGAKAAGLWL